MKAQVTDNDSAKTIYRFQQCITNINRIEKPINAIVSDDNGWIRHAHAKLKNRAVLVFNQNKNRI
jgi:hypothetical protein